MPFGLGRKSDLRPPDPGRFEAFDRALPADPESVGPVPGWTDRDTRDLLGRDLPSFTAFIAGHARSSVAGGALRFLLPDSRPSLTAWNGRSGWQSDWRSKPPAIAFASDWLGGLFLLLAKGQRADGEPALGILTTTTGESTRLEASFEAFIGDVLPGEWRSLLAVDRLETWRAAGNDTPRPDQVVAPKQPLFLGGSDALADLELTPLVVAVSLGGQIWEQVKDLPPGTRIKGVHYQD